MSVRWCILFRMSLTDERIGQIIRLERQKKRLTLDDVGKLIGLNHSTVSNYESGTRRVPSERAESLAKIFGVPVKLLDRQAYAGPEFQRLIDSLEEAYGPGNVTSMTLPDALEEIERLRGLVANAVTTLSHHGHQAVSRSLARNLDPIPDTYVHPEA